MSDFQGNCFRILKIIVTLPSGYGQLTTIRLHRCLTNRYQSMFEEKAGELAGKIWEALNEGGELTGKQLKKNIKTRSDKDLYLALGWLLREGKLNVTEEEKDILVSLK